MVLLFNEEKVMVDNTIDDMQYSPEYAEYIMEHSKGDRIICNGDTLTQAMEDGYLFKEFSEHQKNKESVSLARK